ncbi:neuroglian-like [Mya arenaria]|uniref:neuroglian-like n=1 Tax=Mya arenaria TaxID=6604 RepID=UPI0022E88418|nr:neuroglian-like [Mya arenaria]XP_052782104.1 neuroglian-like [Mya arenaria]XP_052782105.1 neuroglian-like [Mya arenaria]
MIVRVFLVLLCAMHTHAVNRPPNMIQHPKDKDIFYKAGESVVITCIADGIPKPIYRWKRNKEDFNPSGNDNRVVQIPNQGTIVFSRPESKDEGIFQCFADNGYGIVASIKVNLREAKLEKFSYEERKEHYELWGNPLTLPCTPPQSYPSADVYWVIKEQNGRWQAINFNKRISMDLEGRLRFTNVEKSDELNGRAYSCMALNYFMRDNAIGPEHTIKVVGSTPQKRPAYELWTSPSDQFFVKGNTLRLKCIFAGNPTPEVYWSKINGGFPDRMVLKSFGQELEITDLELSDGGQYECTGLNAESQQRATKAFDVRIESAPEWVDEPFNQEMSTNEKVTFICRAKAEPEPNYDWYINGVPLDSTTDGQESVRDPRIYRNPRFHKSRNNITLTGLTLEDHMNIQCNCSNKHGYVWADVYLNVLEEAPTIMVPPPPTLKVAEAQSVTITCVVTGKPDPIITWYRDQNLITGGRFKILPTGNLHIQNVVMADAGDYRCQASNKFAKDVTSSICKMQIRRKTRIEQYPMDLEVGAGRDAKFTCSGSTDFDEAGNMLVYWEKDGKQMSTNEHRMTQNFQDNSLTIAGAIVRDSGVYTCVITNGLDEDRAFAFLTVKDRPDPPSSVEIDRCREKKADIKWVKGIENNAPVIHFIVQYNTTFNPDQWVSVETVDYTQNTATISLSPYANYTFRVIATNKIGASTSSYHTPTVCKTNPEAPNKNPQNVRSIGDRKGFLKIEWIPMNLLEHNGPGFKYQVTVRQRGSIAQGTTYNVDNWMNNTLEHMATDPYFPYAVRVQAKNSIGDSTTEAQEKTLYSYEDVPGAIVKNVEVSDISASTVKLTWTWDKIWLEESGAIAQIHGEFRAFKVQFWRVDEKMSTFQEREVSWVEVLPKEVPAGSQSIKSSYIMRNLPQNAAISLQICVTNNFYVGRPSDPITFTTYEGVPGPVNMLEARIRSSNSFTLVWLPPLNEDRNGIIRGYDIAYQTVDGLALGSLHDRSEQINDPNSVSAVLSGLLPNMKYRIHVYARTQFGRGEGSFIEASTTEKAAIGTPKFEIYNVHENSFNVTWVPDAYFGKHIVHYVEYRKEGHSDWQRSTDEIINNYKAINGLERGTYYEVRVTAYDGLYRASSEVQNVGTVGFAAARAIGSNYGWFIGILVAGVLLIGAAVWIYLMHRWRKQDPRVQEKPKTPRDAKAKKSEHEKMYPDSDEDYDRKRYKEDHYDDYGDEKEREYLRDDADRDGKYDDYRNSDYNRDSYRDDYNRDNDRDYYRDNDRDSYQDDNDRDSYRDDHDDDRHDDYDDRGYARKDRDRYDDKYDDQGRGATNYDEPDDQSFHDDRKGYGEYNDERSKFDKSGAPVPAPRPLYKPRSVTDL